MALARASIHEKILAWMQDFLTDHTGTLTPSPRTCLRKGGHISVPRFGKGPLFTNSRGKKHPYLYENADFLGTKFTPFYLNTLTFCMLFIVHLHVQTIWKTKITNDFLF